MEKNNFTQNIQPKNEEPYEEFVNNFFVVLLGSKFPKHSDIRMFWSFLNTKTFDANIL